MRKQHDRRTWTTIRVPPWKQEDVPEAAMALATERIQYLTGRAMKHPLEYLLACAYLQGINDCVQAHINNPGAFDLGLSRTNWREMRTP